MYLESQLTEYEEFGRAEKKDRIVRYCVSLSVCVSLSASVCVFLRSSRGKMETWNGIE